MAKQSAIDKSVRINGRKRRSWKQADGTWTDPFAPFDFFSRTFLPPNTEVIEAESDEDMEIELKLVSNADIKFKPENLSIESQVKFIDMKLDDKLEKISDIKPIGDLPKRV